MKQYLFCRGLILAVLSLLLLFAASCSDNGDSSNRYNDARLLNVKDSILLTNDETFTLKIFYAKGFHNMTSTVFTVEPADYKICKMTNKFCGMAGDSCIVYIQLKSGESFGNTTVKVKFHDILNKAEGGEVDFNVVHLEKTDGYTDKIDSVELPMQYVKGGLGTLGIPTADSLRLVNTKDPDYGTIILTPERISQYYPRRKEQMGDYYMSRTEVTCKQYKAVMGTVLHGQDDNERAAMLSFSECWDFIRKLSKLTGRKYRMPSIDEWEYAAIGGQKSKGYKYPGSDNVEEVAWSSNGNSSHTIPENPYFVGKKIPNELGLYDMAGNISEWVNDSIYDPLKLDDGTVVLIKNYALKGGDYSTSNSCWVFYPWYTMYWSKTFKYKGLRLVISRKDYEMKPVE